MQIFPFNSSKDFLCQCQLGLGQNLVNVREQFDPTEKVVFQAIQMALIAVLSEVQQLKNCLLNFGQNRPVNQQGAIQKWRRSLVGGEVSKNWSKLLTDCTKKTVDIGERVSKSGKIADIFYGWPLNFDTANCCENDFNSKQIWRDTNCKPVRNNMSICQYDKISIF